MGDEVDFEAEGLLEGCEGPQRESRLKLLDRSPRARRRASRSCVARSPTAALPLVAVDLVLSGDGKRLTAAEVAERAEIEEEFLERQWRALGMALADDDDAVYSERDVEAAKRLATIRAAGVPDEGILEIGRLLGLTMSQLAAANRSVIGEAFIADVDDEYEAAQRISTAAKHFLPLIGEVARVRAPGPPPRTGPPRRLRGRRAARRGRRRGRHGLLRRHGRVHPARRDAGAGRARRRHGTAERARGRGDRAAGASREADRRRRDARRPGDRAGARRGARAGRGGGPRGRRASRSCAPGLRAGRRSRAAATGTGGPSTSRAGSRRGRGPAASSPARRSTRRSATPTTGRSRVPST